VDLGIFAPAAGRIVYGDDGLWAVDPDAPSDTVEGPSVAVDVASALVRFGPADKFPLGWSSDGSELLLTRPTGSPVLPHHILFILHADGSETRLNKDPLGIESATISPDGTRVVFAGEYSDPSGLYVIDAEGGRPVPLPIPQAEEGVGGWPTFSPDGTQIAYLAGNDRPEVWVADADGSNAHEILAIKALTGGPLQGLQWSPAGDRMAMQVPSTLSGESEIYTFAVDGSDLTQVATGADSPYWSPDGSQIAFNIRCDDYRLESSCKGRARAYRPGERVRFSLAIADADGSNVRAFGFAASGPWHPGE
jgi:Tol biopolymer transport system component